MAGFTRTHGDAQPVFAMDTLNGAVDPAAAYKVNTASTSGTAGTTTNLYGPGFDFIKITGLTNIETAGSSNAHGAVEALMRVVATKATVAMYQVDQAQVSVAVYPLGAWSDADLTAALVALGTITTVDFTAAVASNNGLKLA